MWEKDTYDIWKSPYFTFNTIPESKSLFCTQIHLNLQKAVLAALNVEHGAAGEGLSEVEKKASLEVSLIMTFASKEVTTSLYRLGKV